MTSELEERIFRKGSRTYYWSSKFFPQPYKDDVFTLYAYVRTADDYVDAIPARKQDFLLFKKETIAALNRGKSKQVIIHNFVKLAKRKKFSEKHIKSFLSAMERDLKPKPFKDFKDVDAYIHGSAEVIGLFMARIFNLPQELESQAMLLGKAMQYINWLRDLQEDDVLGRRYIPKDVLDKYGFRTVSYAEAKRKKALFKRLIREELLRYYEWQACAATSFKHLPRCMRVPVMTASDAYAWTARKIEKNPLIVYHRKVKPPIVLLWWFVLKNKVIAWTSRRC